MAHPDEPSVGAFAGRDGAIDFPIKDALLKMAGSMSDDHIYRVIEMVGTSGKSIEDAIQSAIDSAYKTLRNLRWFEIVRQSGHIRWQGQSLSGDAQGRLYDGRGRVRHPPQALAVCDFTLSSTYSRRLQDRCAISYPLLNHSAILCEAGGNFSSLHHSAIRFMAVQD